LFVSKLTVYNFRNLHDQSLTLRDGPVYITGLNGNGKTNLVEALYLLSGSRSFRTNAQGELVRWGAKEASVFGVVQNKTGSDEVGVSFSPAGRTAFKNGNALASVSELVGSCAVVAFSPSDLSLVKGSPAGRRKFLDRNMVELEPTFLNTLMAYQRALGSKNALLKEHGVTLEQLEPWNELLTEYGGKIVDKRRKFLKSLEEKAASFYSSFAPSDGQLKLCLESELVRNGEQLGAERVREEFRRLASREIALRATLIGPHRDDVAITFGGAIDSRSFASQGQTRSIVLALTLGVIELLEETLGETPIVILDDVDSELDAERSKKLFSTLASKQRQLIITGTAQPPAELASGGSTEVQQIRVDGGVVFNN
jgi:DNA replication and repair protein RecF